MSRNTGSSELFSLIHSLTSEEKGYYKKFSKRHIPNGSNYLKLFDAISKQAEFEEASLRKKFKNYAVMKVYLKDLITDSLLLYHKNRHPHVSLFSQVQKIHILLLKGQYPEAVRILKKTLEQSRKMEVFTVERYLLRVWAEINHQHLTNPKVIQSFGEEYKKETQHNWLKESNLTEWELLSIEWLGKVRGQDPFDKGKTDVDVESVTLRPANSLRSEIKKLHVLNYQHNMRKDYNNKYIITKKEMQLSEQFKKQGDASFNNIFIRNNYIASCLDINKFKDAINEANEMIKSESEWGFYYDLAFPKSVFFKLDAYFHMGLYKDGLDLIRKVDKEMLTVSARVGDNTALREYYMNKLMYLFANRLYQECWIEMQTVKLKSLIESNLFDYADYAMLQLMIQFEMGNRASLHGMSVKLEHTFAKLGIEDFTYLSLLNFFKNIKAQGNNNLAVKTKVMLDDYYKQNNLPTRQGCGLMEYTKWLSAVAVGKQIGG